MIEIFRRTFEGKRARVVFLELSASDLDLFLQALEPSAPAIHPANNGGIDDEALPAPGGTQRALERRCLRV